MTHQHDRSKISALTSGRLRLLLKPQPGLATLSGFLIHHDGSLTSVVDPARIMLPFSAIGLAAE